MTRKDKTAGAPALKGMILAAMFGAATAAGAFVIIPFPLVPITLQTFFTSLAGALLGAPLGALSQLIYLLLGILGLPVFAGGKAGLGVLFGPTGGYLTGFVAAAFVVGKLTRLRENPGLAWIAASMAVGQAVIYLLGIGQLTLVAGLSLVKALSVGFLPFLVGDALKIALAAVLVLRLRDRVRP